MTLLARLDAVINLVSAGWTESARIELRAVRAEIEAYERAILSWKREEQTWKEREGEIEKRDEAVRKVAEQMDGHIEICQTIRDHVCPADMWSARLREALKDE